MPVFGIGFVQELKRSFAGGRGGLAVAMLSLLATTGGAEAACQTSLDFGRGGVGTVRTLDVSTCSEPIRFGGLFNSPTADAYGYYPITGSALISAISEPYSNDLALRDAIGDSANITLSNGAVVNIDPGPKNYYPDVNDSGSASAFTFDTYKFTVVSLGTSPVGTGRLYYSSNANLAQSGSNWTTSTPFDVSFGNLAYNGPEISVTSSIGGIVTDGGTNAQGTQTAGEPVTVTYTVSNSGNATLTLLSATASALSNVNVGTITPPGSASVLPGLQTTFRVTYTPTASGAFSFNLSFGTNDTAKNPFNFTVSGTSAYAAPTITSISPNSGVTGGGTNVTITGTNFSSASDVTFGGTSATTFTVASPTQIRAVSPPGSGTAEVRVIAAGGTSPNAGGADNFSYYVPPVLSISATPSDTQQTVGRPYTITLLPSVSVAQSVGTLYITTTLPVGQNFTSDTGGNWTCVTSGRNLTCTNPDPFTPGFPATPLILTLTPTASNAGFSPTFTMYGGRAESDATTTTSSITVNVLPAIQANAASTTLPVNVPASFTPATYTSGGTAPFTWSVSPALPDNLMLDPATGTVSGTPTASRDSTLYSFSLTDARGATNTISYRITVLPPPPVVTAVRPQSGSAMGGTLITIDGSSLASVGSILIGGITGATIQSVTDTRITALTAARAAGGALDVQAYNASGPSPVAGLDAQFTFVAPSLGVSITPALVTEQTVGRPFSIVAKVSADAADVTSPLTLSITTLATLSNFSGTDWTCARNATGATCSYTNTIVAGGGTGFASDLTMNATFGSTGPGQINMSVSGNNATTGSTLKGYVVNQAVATAVAIGGISTRKGQFLAAVTPVTATGGTGAKTWTIAPDLPDGLAIDPATGELSGTPTAVSSPSDYTVTVTDERGSSDSKSFNLRVSPEMPIVTSISPSTGPVTGGTRVTITGTGLADATKVSFGNTDVPLAQFLSINGNQIVVAAPPKTAGTYDVIVTAPGGISAASAADQFTYTAVPVLGLTVTRANLYETVGKDYTFFITPSASQAATSGTLTLTATLPVGQVFSNRTVTNSWTCNTAGQTLTCTDSRSIPAGSTGTPLLIYATPEAANSLFFQTFTLSGGGAAANATASASVIVNESPTTAVASATTSLTVGRAASFTPVTRVGGGTSSFTWSVSPNLPSGLSLSSSNGTVSGTPGAVTATADYTFTLTDARGATSSQTVQIGVQDTAPVVTSVSPSRGTTGGGTRVTISGTGLDGVTRVNFGNSSVLNADFVSVSATEIVVNAPAKTAGSYDVTVTTPSGTSAISAATRFTYVAPLLEVNARPVYSVVTTGAIIDYRINLVPRNAATGGRITLTTTLPAGVSFYTNSSFDGWMCSNAGQDVTCWVDSSIAQDVPNTPRFRVTMSAPGVVDSFDFTISGGGLAGPATYSFDAVQVNPLPTMSVVQPPLRLTVGQAITPVTPTSVSGGTPSFRWSVSPALPSGLSMDSTTGEITGTPGAAVAERNYVVTATDAFDFDASATIRLATVVPPSPLLALTVTKAGISQATVGRAFPYVLWPSVLEGTADTSGTLTLRTTLPANLTPGAPSGAGWNCTTSGQTVTCTSTTVIAAGTIGNTVTLPVTASVAGVYSPSFSLSGGGALSGVTSTPANITVNEVPATGIASATNSLTVNAAASFTPVIQTGGGTAPFRWSVSPALPANLSLDRATGTVSGTPTAITAAADYTFTLADARGATSSQTVQIGVQDTAPVVTSVSPSRGPTAGGTRVTISGTGLDRVTGVNFGTMSILRADFVSVSANEIVVDTPARAAGIYDVVVTSPAGGSAVTAATSFTFGNAPTLAAFTYGTVVPYNGGAAPPTLIDAASLGSVTGSPTAYDIAVPSARGAMVSISAAGLVSYTPPASARGVDTFSLTATNAFGTSAPAVVTVTIGDPVLTASLNPAPAAVGQVYSQTVSLSGGKAPYSAISVSGLPPGLSISAEGVISGTPTEAGTFASVLITATDSSDPAFSGTAAAITITVGKAPQTITFANPGSQVIGTNPILSASSSSGLMVSFTSLTPATCTITMVGDRTSTGALDFLGAGTCEIAADQAGDSDTEAATQVVQSFEITTATQTITFDNPGPLALGRDVDLVASSTSGMPVTFVSGTPAICTVTAAGRLTPVAAGRCEVTATQTGDGTYAAATPVTQRFDIGKAAQTVSFPDPAETEFSPGKTIRLAAQASSGLPVVYTSLTPDQCAVSRTGMLSFLAPGTCQVAADQPGNADVAAAERVVKSFVVKGIDPVVETELISQMQVARARAVVLNLPDLSSLLGGDVPADSTAFSLSSKGGDLEVIRMGGPVWMRLSGSLTDWDGGARDHYLQLSFGSHLSLGPKTILGLTATLDNLHLTDPKGSTKGKGWLVGPYFVTRLGETPLTFELRALKGRTSDSIAQTGQPASDVDGTRSLVSARLSGAYAMNDHLTLRPKLSVAAVEETSEAYIAAGGTPIGAVSTTYRHQALGLDMTYVTANSAGPITLNGGLGWFLSDDGANAKGQGLTYSLGFDQAIGTASTLTIDITGQANLDSQINSVGVNIHWNTRF